MFCNIQRLKWSHVYLAAMFLVTVFLCHVYTNHWLPIRNTNDAYRIVDAPMRVAKNALEGWPIIGLGFFSCRFIRPKLDKQPPFVLCLIGFLLLLASLFVAVGFVPTFPLLGKYVCNIFPVLGFICLFKSIQESPVTRFFVFWGANSIVLMCMHFSIFEECCKVIDSKWFAHKDFWGWWPLVYFVLTLILTYPLVYVFNSFPFFLGKKHGVTNNC